MKRFLLLFVLALSFTRSARADYIMLCSDQNGSTCYTSVSSSVTHLYVWHFNSYGTRGAAFTIDISQVPGTTLLGFISPYSVSGDVNGTLSVFYNDCLEGSYLIGTVYLTLGCGEVRVAPASSFDCSFGLHTAYSDLVGALCSCGTQTSRCFPSPTEQSTWGSVKAMYR
jgi:hypothetical protein